MRSWRCWIVTGVIGSLGWGGAAAGLDLYGGRAVPAGGWDAIVVAGAGVMPGGVPSDALVARTRRAVDLFDEGRAPILAEAWGVPAPAIVTEDVSTSTEENARELAAVLGPARILVVTDRYHVLRCERVFARYFPEVGGVGVTSPPRVRARGALREVLAVGLYAVTGRL